MIVSSQVSFTGDHSRQTSTVDSSQLRLSARPTVTGQATQATETTLFREASYRYQSSEQLAFTRTSSVSGAGQSAVFTSAQLLESASELLLTGQQALNVSRAVFGGEPVARTGGEVTVTGSRYQFYSEAENRNLTSSGSITLQTGETIDFTLSLQQSQSRSYEYSELVQIREQPMTDPLVINFGTATARLTDTLFEFDLNGDGQTGQFATLGSGSGYLVFDRNGNGKVDDGTELFGPQSGSGFSELAKYDDDGNQWIDANDEIFSMLSVWVQTTEEGPVLRSLAEVGVQALYVGSVDDRFTLTNPQGVPLGQIRASGIYLTTDGEVRTLEELDLAEQNTIAAPETAQSLGVTQPPDPVRPERVQPAEDVRNAAIREALGKLQEIRQQQQAFIEASKEQGQSGSPLDDYLRLIDRLRIALLSGQDVRRQAASQYQAFSRL